MRTNNNLKLGFSMVEIVVAASVFAILSMSVYQAYASVLSFVTASKAKLVATDLINEQFELVRNLPYSSVGIQGGLPNGLLLQNESVTKGGFNFSIERQVRNIDDDYDGNIGGSPNDLSPADYKLVEISVDCLSCKNFVKMTTNSYVAPKNLETSSENGALFVKVFDANGVPVVGASVSITNVATTATLVINDVTDNQGMLQIVDVPPGINAYQIIVTKAGFTTDRTYATSTGNPNPVKPNATVLVQQVTQVSFVIDKVTDINIYTINKSCGTVPSVAFSYSGTKLLGISPDIYKFNGNLITDSSGFKHIQNVDWDSYDFTVTGGDYISGTNPLLPVSVSPDSIQNVNIVVSQGLPPHLVVIVKDFATGLPVSDAAVSISGSSFNDSLVTNQGYLNQTDWSLGAGQTNFGSPSMYYQNDGNVNDASPAGELKLSGLNVFYVPSGEMTSSIFDTGTTSNFSNVYVTPSSQPLEAGPSSVKLQIATSPNNTSTSTWNYLGPDGTAGTFYSLTDHTINPIHDGDRYLRYKLFLSTLDSTKTPNVSDVAITYSSECIPPGQVEFSSIPNGSYTLDVSKAGYQSQSLPVNVNSNWQKQEVLLQP